MFPDADVWDVNRENSRRHLSFGYGIHRCLGARLAELQLQTLIEEMAKRNMEVTFAGEPECACRIGLKRTTVIAAAYDHLALIGFGIFPAGPCDGNAVYSPGFVEGRCALLAGQGALCRINVARWFAPMLGKPSGAAAFSNQAGDCR